MKWQMMIRELEVKSEPGVGVIVCNWWKLLRRQNLIPNNQHKIAYILVIWIGLNVTTTPITAMGCRQCLPLSVVQLEGRHCRYGVVDAFGSQQFLFFNKLSYKRWWRWNIKEIMGAFWNMSKWQSQWPNSTQIGLI